MRFAEALAIESSSLLERNPDHVWPRFMSTRRLVQNTIQSNLVVQNALAAQAIDLEAQLKDLDHLIVRHLSFALPSLTTT